MRRLISKADSSTKDEIERLIAGETIVKSIRLDLTYDEIESTIDNMWSVLSVSYTHLIIIYFFD